MKNYFKIIRKTIIVLLSISCISVNATSFEKIRYKNIYDGQKITVKNGIWSTKIKHKDSSYFIKKVPQGFASFTEFYNSDGELLFSTATNYEFIYKGSLIGYSNSDLKFYEFYIKNGVLEHRELTFDEVQDLFPKYKIVKINDFSETNSYKLKKKNKKIKLILLNDTDKVFYNYNFSTNNSDIEYYLLKGFVNIIKRGLIQFSNNNSDSKNNDWYVILVR